MVLIEIKLFASLRDRYGVRLTEVECDGTIRNLVENAARKLGKSFLASVYDSDKDKVRNDLIFAINGRNLKDLRGEIELKEGDKIAIFPPVAGG